MKKFFIYTIIFITLSISLSSETIYVAPILFINSGNENYISDIEFQENFVTELNNKKGLLQIEIKKTNNKADLRSSYDALNLCKSEKIAYLIYGWVKKTDYFYECELRIFDGEGRKNIYTVYGKDSIDDKNKFIENTSQKILEKLKDIFFVPEREDKFKTLINVQTKIGYWLFTNKAWANHITGIMVIGNGFELIPVDLVAYAKKAKLSFSIGMHFDYLLGISKKNTLPSYLSTLSINLFSNSYFKLHELHSVFFSFGILYALDILYYKDMYEKAKINTFSAFGMNFGIGYKYTFKENISLILELNQEFVFYSKPMSKFYLNLGIDFLVFSKEQLK